MTTTEQTTPQAAEALRDLRSIESMYSRLQAQAAIDATRGDLSGSDAMVALGPVGNAEAWENLIEAAEEAHLADPDRNPYPFHVADEHWHGDGEHPLAVLAYWSDFIREELGEATDARATTIASEADYLRSRVEWAATSNGHGDANLLEFQQLAGDLRSCRLRLENILREGERPERGIPCIYDSARLERTIDDSGHRSDWTCRKCGRTWTEERYDAEVYRLHEAAKLEVIDGVMWCTEEYAAHCLKRSVKTIRTWANGDHVRRACMVAGQRRHFVCLDDVYDQDARAKRRNRNAA